jgi:tetratricopeptide (TPR) repeat protein
MKAERRHELKHNELADWIGEHLEPLKPHAPGIVLGAVLLMAIVLGGVWYFGGENQASARAWSDYFSALNEREPQKVLQNVVTDRSGSKAAWWALAALGDMNLGEGAAMLHSDRNEAEKRLEAAERAYKQVEASDDPMLKARAWLGLAKVYESKCQPEKAHEYYDMVAKHQPDSAIGKAASEAARRMKDPREVEFLKWFAQQQPKRPAPFPGIGGNVPGLPSDLPERPDIGLPTGFNLDTLGPGSRPDPATVPPPLTPPVPATTPGDSAAPAPAEPKSPAPEAKTDAPKSDAPDAPDGSENKPD